MTADASHARLGDQLCFALYSASKVVAGAYRPGLNALGLTYPQYLAMLALWENDGPTVAGLGGVLGLDSGTLSPLVKRLENSGLIRRERSDRDERVVRLQLTAKGAALEEEAASVRRSVEASTGLAHDEFLRLRESLETLTAAVAGAASHRGSTGPGSRNSEPASTETDTQE